MQCTELVRCSAVHRAVRYSAVHSLESQNGGPGTDALEISNKTDKLHPSSELLRRLTS